MGITSIIVAVSFVSSGANYEFDAITAVLVGGTSLAGERGTIYGAVIGALLLRFVNNMMIQLDFLIYLSGALKGAVILQYMTSDAIDAETIAPCYAITNDNIDDFKSYSCE